MYYYKIYAAVFLTLHNLFLPGTGWQVLSLLLHLEVLEQTLTWVGRHCHQNILGMNLFHLTNLWVRLFCLAILCLKGSKMIIFIYQNIMTMVLHFTLISAALPKWSRNFQHIHKYMSKVHIKFC